MKRFIITITLLVALVGSAFAEEFVLCGQFINDDEGEYLLFIDIDAREPYDAEKEQLSFFIDFQNRGFSKVEVHSYKMTEDCKSWAASMSREHRVYCTFEVHEKYNIIRHVCGDGTVIEYIGFTNKGEE